MSHKILFHAHKQKLDHDCGKKKCYYMACNTLDVYFEILVISLMT